MENVPENGVQRISDIIVDQRTEEDTPMLHLELEDSEDANEHEISMEQSEETEQDMEDMVNILKHKNIYIFLFECMIVEFDCLTFVNLQANKEKSYFITL